jgi:trehalose 6-phosphate phosphatase
MSEILPAPPVPDPASISLFLDFDGTLVDLVERPDEVLIDVGLNALLARLHHVLDGRLALVSGRSIAQLDAFLAMPELIVAGGHGVERRHGDGRRDAPPRPDSLETAESWLRAFASDHPGLIVEPKSHGIALHYRLAPEREAAAHDVMAALADEHGLRLQPGKMMIELRAGDCDKGDAVRAFMGTSEMRGTRPVVLGDDVTDEAAFAAAADLGGYGVRVGAPCETRARHTLPDVAAVRAWLEALAA